MLSEIMNEIKSNPRLLIQAIAEYGQPGELSDLAGRLDGININRAVLDAAKEQMQRDTDLTERMESDRYFQDLPFEPWERAA